MLLSACAIPHYDFGQEAKAEFVIEKQQQALNTLRWHLKAAVQIEHPSGRQRFRVDWRQRQQHYNLRVSSAFGATLLQLRGSPAGVTAINAKGERRQSRDLNTLSAQLLGVALPLDYLRWWVLGSPAPHLSAESVRRVAGGLSSFSQQGWQVSYAYDDANVLDKIHIAKHGFEAEIKVGFLKRGIAFK